MKSNYQAALKRVLVHEGGKVDHPRDPGGRTNQGVTQRVYTAFRSRKGLPARDVYAMTDIERDEIYDLQYWDTIKGDSLPAGVDYVVFDGAVNSGPAQSIKWLQRALGVNPDGVIGQKTLAAITEYPDHDRLIALICERRLAFLRALTTWRTFGKGWQSRVNNVKAIGQAQATGSVAPGAVFFFDGNQKGTIDAAKRAPMTVVSDATAGGGVGVVGGFTWLKDQLDPYVGVLPHLDTVVAAVAVTGIALTAGSAAYSFWARKRAAKLADALDTQPKEIVTG